MAGHYFYDPRPYYGLNMSSNLMPLDELFYKYEPVPYWMDQRMVPMAYPVDYHSKQVMTRAPEVQQQLLPSNRSELAVRDDIYTDVYKRPPHFNGFAPYPEMRQPRGQSHDDSWLPSQYANPQTQFPQRGYGAMPAMPPMPMPMGYMGNNGNNGGYMSNQHFAPQNHNNGEQYGHMEAGSKSNKNQGSNNHNKKNYNSDDEFSNKSNKSNKNNKNSYNNDASYGNKQMHSNDHGSYGSKQMHNNDHGSYGSKQMHSNDHGSYGSKQMHSNDHGSYGNKQMYSNVDTYGTKSNKKQTQHYDDDDDDDHYSSKSKKGMSNDDDGYGTKSSQKMYSNDDNYSNKSRGNTNYGKQQGSAKKQNRYMNDTSDDDDDDEDDEPLLKHGKGGGYSHSKISGKGSSAYHSHGGGNNNMVVKQSAQKYGSHNKSIKMSFRNGADSSSDDDDDYYAYTKKASKAGPHSQGVTKVQHPSHGHGYGVTEQPRHTQFYSQTKGVELKVPLCCDNCERKVMACLERVDGVVSVLCDQWQKKVVVYGNVRPEVVLKKVRRVKRGAELWQQQQQVKRIQVY